MRVYGRIHRVRGMDYDTSKFACELRWVKYTKGPKARSANARTTRLGWNAHKEIPKGKEPWAYDEEPRKGLRENFDAERGLSQ